ncbi:MAG TPA: hypothetical protein VN959_05910 [Mycobacterium sp.]|nr:hypothetical protein [Mycobacterium sp.]
MFGNAGDGGTGGFGGAGGHEGPGAADGEGGAGALVADLPAAAAAAPACTGNRLVRGTAP